MASPSERMMEQEIPADLAKFRDSSYVELFEALRDSWRLGRKPCGLLRRIEHDFAEDRARLHQLMRQGRL